MTFNGGAGADVLTGGTMDDIFTGGAGEDTFTGNGGNDTLNGESDNEVFTIDEANNGMIVNGGLTETFTDIEILKGGGGTDSAIVNAVNNGGNPDTIILRVDASDPAILEIDASSAFEQVDIGDISTVTVNGRLGNDNFTIEDDLTSIVGITQIDVNGGDGNDTFAFENAGFLPGSINGEGGTNTLQGDANGNIFTVTMPNEGTLTDSDAGMANKITDGFSNIQNLTGGADDDTFAFEASGTLMGTIDGGTATSETGDTLNVSLVAANSVTAKTVDGDGVDGDFNGGTDNFDNIDTLNATDITIGSSSAVGGMFNFDGVGMDKTVTFQASNQIVILDVISDSSSGESDSLTINLSSMDVDVTSLDDSFGGNLTLNGLGADQTTITGAGANALIIPSNSNVTISDVKITNPEW